MRLQPLVLLTLLSCAAPAAFAQSAAAPDDATQTMPATTPAQERQPLDADHDGIITREEAKARPGIAKHFDQLDTNHDGKIDRSEFQSAQDRMKSRREQKQAQQAEPAEASSSD